MNLIEAFKQIGRDIKALVTRADSIEKDVEKLKKTGTTSSDDTSSTDLEQIKQDVLDLKTLKYFGHAESWSDNGSGKPHVWEELEDEVGYVGLPIENLPFYCVKSKTGGLTLFGLDNPPYFIDPETKVASWNNPDYEWTREINAYNVLGFELLGVGEESWESYNDSKNKREGNGRRLVTRTFGDDKQQGLWYVDDDGHFRRLVDTIIELEKEILKLKEGK